PTAQYEQLAFRVLLLVIAYLFFCWFWTHGGQTLGMRAWKIRLLNLDNGPVTWLAATGRFCLAILSWLLLGLGYFSMLWDPDGLSWHDRLSSTHLVLLAKQTAQDNSGNV
ncbi:MAG: RDD family protein, partial [Acidiferrobacterales bacterium]